MDAMYSGRGATSRTSRTRQNKRGGHQVRSTTFHWHIGGILLIGLLLLLSNDFVIQTVSPLVFSFSQHENRVKAPLSVQRSSADNGGDDHYDAEEATDEDQLVADLNSWNTSAAASTSTKTTAPEQTGSRDHQNKEDAVKDEPQVFRANTTQPNNINIKGPLERSKRQQIKFDRQKGSLEKVFDTPMRYYVDLYEFGANVVNEEWAYLHIFKNGGTTIEVQTGHDHTSIQDPQVQKRKWFTFVRDPIEHFLSGWAECAHRERMDAKIQSQTKNLHTPIPSNTTIQGSYDQRVNDWITKVAALARPGIEAACEIHSFPQANALLDPNGHLAPQLQIVADLTELPAVLTNMIGFTYNPNIESGRNASANTYLQTYFPKRKQWLSETTLQRLCAFLEMDYFLFDFEMPTSCRNTFQEMKTNKSTTTTLVSNKKSTSMEDVGRELAIQNTSQQTFLQRMSQDSSLQLSRRQQAAFEERKGQLSTLFPYNRRFPSNLGVWGGNLVTDHWAYLHIFKNGGTTIAAQTTRWHTFLTDPKVVKRSWFTVVRDPLKHFLSGWAECGNREHKARYRKWKAAHPNVTVQPMDVPVPDQLTLKYDTRIQQWLTSISKFARWDHRFDCEVHSLPQVNSMMDRSGQIAKQLQVVGDLKELPAVLKLIGFQYDHKIATERNATASAFLRSYYPKRVDLLSNTTIQALCDFLSIDYYLLDYPLPEACSDMPVTGYHGVTKARTLVLRRPTGQTRHSRIVLPDRESTKVRS